MKPIIFSTEMVRAILEGRKTQTRRVIRPQPKLEKRESLVIEEGQLKQVYHDPGSWKVGDKRKLPYQPGEILWVREAFAYREFDSVVYKAGHQDQKWVPKWKPAIHMPRWATRIFLKVTNIRVERVQDIKENDAIAEGMTMIGPAAFTNRTSFGKFWDSINAKRGYGWDVNPWVWVIEFERAEKQEDNK